jgi:membrane protein implicated in regulation of membrane protease activity
MTKAKTASMIATVAGVAACAPQIVPLLPPQYHAAAYSIVSIVTTLLGLFARSPLHPKLPTLDPLR